MSPLTISFISTETRACPRGVKQLGHARAIPLLGRRGRGYILRDVARSIKPPGFARTAEVRSQVMGGRAGERGVDELPSPSTRIRIAEDQTGTREKLARTRLIATRLIRTNRWINRVSSRLEANMDVSLLGWLSWVVLGTRHPLE